MAALRRGFLLALAVVLTNGCGGESRPGGPISVALDTTGGAHAAFVVVRGLSSAELAALRSAGMGALDSSPGFFRVEVESGAGPSVAGRYFVSDTALEFVPRFPFDAGRSYLVSVDPSKLPTPRSEAIEVTTFALPAGDRTPRTQVALLYPRSDTVPENLLRLYVHFTAPMSHTGALEHVRLLDDGGREVKAAFLPLEADFWDGAHQRYTLFLDPGRVKQGIRPNEELGRALIAGRRYTIVIDSTWLDARGVPLKQSFRRTFVVSRADDRPIDLKSWQLRPPVALKRDPVTVIFPKPLDHGLMLRSLGVETAAGEPIQGDMMLELNERTWRFQPTFPWRAGEYRLVVLTILEDPQGNQIDKPFEVDMFERVDKSAEPERKYIPFTVR